MFSIDSEQELTTVTFLRVEGTKNLKADDGIAHSISVGSTPTIQGTAGNINEDSMDAATAILDAASINPALDQSLNSGNDTAGASATNPIAMLNQEQIRYLINIKR